MKRWTWAEEQLLVDRHGDTPVRELAAMLGRSEKSVRTHMDRIEISLRDTGTHVRVGGFSRSTWTEDEDFLLIEHLYEPMCDVAQLFPDRSYAGVWNRAVKLGRPKRYKGWTISGDGRKLIRVGGGYVAEHRLVAAKTLGRPLAEGEQVHHINCDKSDNDPLNLYVYDSRSAHMSGHRTLDRAVKELLDRGLIRFDGRTGRYEVC